MVRKFCMKVNWIGVAYPTSITAQVHLMADI